jgi:hypothetical protein
MSEQFEEEKKEEFHLTLLGWQHIEDIDLDLPPPNRGMPARHKVWWFHDDHDQICYSLEDACKLAGI